MCQIWVEFVQKFWRWRFKNLSLHFYYFVITSPLRMGWTFIWKIESILCAKCVWKCPIGSGEEDYYVFLLFCNYLYFEKGVSLIWKKETWIIFTQGYFVLSLVLLASGSGEKKMNMWKINTQTDRQTGRRRTTDDHKKHTWAFSSGQLKFISWNFIDYFIG